MIAELSHKLLMKIYYDINNVIWSAYKMLRFNLKPGAYECKFIVYCIVYGLWWKIWV